MIFHPIEAHRAPDPAPIDEPAPEPFENTDPHQPPIRTPLNDEPVHDPNPSTSAARLLHRGAIPAIQSGRTMSAVPGHTRRGNSREASMQPPSA